jgi:hypothetical protein
MLPELILCPTGNYTCLKRQYRALFRDNVSLNNRSFISFLLFLLAGNLWGVLSGYLLHCCSNEDFRETVQGQTFVHKNKLI